MKKIFAVLALVCLSAQAQANAPKKSNAPARKSDAASVSSPSSNRSFARAVRGAVIRPLFGLAFMSPSKFNDFLVAPNNFPDNSSIKVGGGVAYGLALEYPVMRDLYLGLRFERMTASGSKINSGGANYEASVSATPLMLTGTYLFPVARDFRVGPTVGAGLALGFNGTLERSASQNTQNLPNGTLTASATPFRGLFGAVANYEFTRVMGLQFQTGYQMMSSSELSLEKTSAFPNVTDGAIAKNADGKDNLEVSGSSFFMALALSVTL